MAGLSSHKLRAATLVEVLVALIIIMVIFGIAMMVYVNVLRSSYSDRQLAVSLMLKKISAETISAKSYFDETIERNGIRVNKTVTKYKNFDHVLHLHLETETASGNAIVDYDRLINTDDEAQN